MNAIKTLLLIPHVRIHNANALSSPYTIGFPAMTAWLGGVHALQRHCQSEGIPIQFDAVAVISHDYQLQTYRGENDFVSSVIGTGNPLTKKGQRPSFIEEPRIHLEVSLLIECRDALSAADEKRFKQRIVALLHRMKLASGDIQGFDEPEFMAVEDGVPDDVNRVCRLLMPGYVLVERRDLMIEAMENGQDALDALIDFMAVQHRSEPEVADSDSDQPRRGHWYSERYPGQSNIPGWIVPIATGFQGISEPGQACNQRDEEVPHCFAESLVTLGEFKMPHKFHTIEDMLWRYHFDASNHLYQCVQASDHCLD